MQSGSGKFPHSSHSTCMSREASAKGRARKLFVLLSILLHAGMFAVLQPRHGLGDGMVMEQDASATAISVALRGEGKPMQGNAQTGAATAPRRGVYGFTREKHSNPAAETDSAIPVFIPADPYYYPAQDLTEKPAVLHDFFSGMVILVPDLLPPPAILRLFINEEGRVDKVELEESMFSEQAREFIVSAFSEARFRPGRIGHLPVKSQIRIEVELTGTTGP